MLRLSIVLTTLALAGAACSDPAGPPKTVDAGRPRRKIDPPTGEVRPLPPHAIRADGIGPYKLGATLKSILALQPHGPRVVLMEIDGLLDYSVVRAEEDALVIGADRGAGGGSGVRYIAVLDPEMARTESGIGVGSTRRDLEATAGEALASPGLLMDPSMLAFASLPNARFILREGKVAAVMLRADSGVELAPVVDATTPASAVAPAASALVDAAAPTDAGAGAAPHCGAPGSVERATLVEVAKLRLDEVSAIRWGCVSGSGSEAVVVAGDQVVVVAHGPGEAKAPPASAGLRRVTGLEIPGLVFAGPLRGEDGRDDIAAVVQRAVDDGRVIEMQLYRLDGGRLVRTVTQEIYRLGPRSAGWIGATLADVELLIELRARGDDVEVTGALVHRAAPGVAGARDLAPLLPVTVARRRPRPAGAGSGSGSGGGTGSGAAVDAAVTAPGPRDAGASSSSPDAAASRPTPRRDAAVPR